MIGRRRDPAPGPATPGLQAYLDRILAMPRITRQEEADLFLAWREHGDSRASSRLITSHLRYVLAIALGYRQYPVALEDIISEGTIGLLMALERFDPDRGTRFITYATFWIRACILDLVVRSFHSCKHRASPFSTKMFFRIRRERARLLGRFAGSGAGSAEIARRLGVTAEKLAAMIEEMDAQEVSLDQPPAGDRAPSLRDSLGDAGPLPDEIAASKERASMIRRAVAQAVASLGERERLVVHVRMLDHDCCSLAEVGRLLGVSRERARQIESRALGNLRCLLEEKAPDLVAC